METELTDWEVSDNIRRATLVKRVMERAESMGLKSSPALDLARWIAKYHRQPILHAETLGALKQARKTMRLKAVRCGMRPIFAGPFADEVLKLVQHVGEPPKVIVQGILLSDMFQETFTTDKFPMFGLR